MNNTSPLKMTESTVADVQARNDAYSPLMERFASFFIMKEKARESVHAAGITPPECDSEKLANGIPVLSEMDLTPWNEPLKHVAHMLLPVIIKSLGLNAKSEEGLQTFFLTKPKTAELIRLRLDDNQDQLIELAKESGITPAEALPFAVDVIAGPVLGNLADALADELDAITWDRPHCPCCGSAPSIAHLTLPESGQSDYLVGGGGKKLLHCSLCGHDWHFARTACPSCGNVDDKTRDLIFVDKAQHERVESCRACGKYLLCVDMREYAEQPALDALQPGLIHLDILAQQQSLSPLTPTLWNTLT